MNITNLQGKVILITNEIDDGSNTPARYTMEFAEGLTSWYGGDVVEMFTHDYNNIEEELSNGNIVVYECNGLNVEAAEQLKLIARDHNGIVILDRLGHKENFSLSEIVDIELSLKTTLEVKKDRHNSTVFKSNRDIKLVTQSIHEIDESDYKGILTVEDYNKWYKIFIIRPDRTIEAIYDPLYEAKITDEQMWIDHTVSPRLFHETAKHLGLFYDDETFSKVCSMFAQYVLEDWGKLKYHLPEPGDDI